MNRIKKNDMAVVITGKDKGKKGQIIEILPKKDKVMIKGIALVSKHYRARRQNEASGIKKIEAYIDISNVMPICTACNTPTRTGIKNVNNVKVRTCKRCNENF